ncbi:HEAT repeat domain-containing protein [bacterium]|nr:HEAT repeat domain-containing protein [bacterium]
MSLLKDVIERLDSKEEDVRLSTIEDIVENNLVEAVPYLLKRLTREDSLIVKETIIFALKTLDCSGVYNQLFLLFRSPDAYLRNSAIDIFASSGDKAVKFLMSRYNDEDNKEVKKLILDTLYRIGTHNAILGIRLALRDQAINVKITAVEYLGRIRDYDSVPELLNIVRESTHPMLTSAVVDALINIDDKEALESILNILMPENNPDLIQSIYIPQILKILGKLGRINLIVAILDRLEDIELYAEEIINTIDELSNDLLEEILSYSKVKDILLDILRNDSIDEVIRYKAGEYFLRIADGTLADTLLDIGVSLLTASDSLKVIGIHMIGKSKHEEAKKVLLEMVEYLDDEVIKKECINVLNLLLRE